MSCYSIKLVNFSWRKISIYVLFITFSFNHCLGQSRKINFQTLHNGLSNQHVRCILKDSKGFIWFGTNEGLNKFDGSNITIYENNVNDSNSLVNSTITMLFEDRKQNLWVGTSRGLCIYNREKDNFKIFKDFGRKQFMYITTLLEDNNNIWIGTAGLGIYRYDVKTDKLFHYLHDEKKTSSVSSDFVNCIVSDKKGKIWVGSHSGLDLFDSKNNSFRHFNEHNIGYIRQIKNDAKGNLWIGTYGKGLYKLSGYENNWQLEHFSATDKQGSLSSNDILSLLFDRNGNLWVGTENGGLNLLPAQSSAFIVYKSEDGNQQTISSNSIWSLYQDITGIIWIGTYNHGLNYIDERIEQFEVYQRNYFENKTLVNNNVMNFSEDQQGNIWVATDGGGISSFDIRTRAFTNKFNNASISSKAAMAVLCDSKQRIWVGTWGGGIDLFDITGNKIHNYRIESRKRPSNIMHLMEDNSGNIWACSAGNGLLLYHPESNDFKKVIDETGLTHLNEKAFTNVMFQDSENTIWVGLSYSLISIKYVNGKRVFTEYKHTLTPGSISSPIITALHEDSHKNIWIGTDNGLNLFDKKKGTFTIFRKEDGLPNNSINGILEDNNKYLWIGTYNGIAKFDPEQKRFKNYNKEDGLPSNSFNVRSYLKTRSGMFFFGSNNGFVTFSPDSIQTNLYVPPVYFTDFKIFNISAVIGSKDSPLSQSIGSTHKITLNHRQTSFTIEFVSLNFTHSAKNQYKYKLEGFDKGWINSGTRKYATYTNIDPGKYVFKVMGSNNHEIWNPKPIQLEITVLPPVWKTRWAYLLYLTVFFIILWGFIKLLLIKSRQAEKLRLEQIHYKKSEELNRMKIQFFANISHEFRTPLSLILPPLKQIIEKEPLQSETKKRMEMVFRNANKLFGLVNELMDFTKSEEGRLMMKVEKEDLVSFLWEIHSTFTEEAIRKNISYRFEPETESIEAWFDKNKMEKVISNLLSNAFKFTFPNGSITLGLTTILENEQSFASISVKDNGSGISPNYINKIFDRFYQSPEEENKHIAGTGIGLALVKTLVELHHGKVSVTSRKWEETCFTVKIPLGNNHFAMNEMLSYADDIIVPNNFSSMVRSKADQQKSEGNVPLILVVEDNAELCDYLVSILIPKYNVIKASDGAEGLRMAQESVPDLIVSDVVMPKLSGTELCRAIKNEMSTSHIPIILLTSKATTPEVIEGIESGADAYIPKPFDIQHLEVTIEKTIETRRKLYQRFSQNVYIMPSENTDNDLDKKFILKILAYIDENVLNDNITVENLAAHLLMSRTNVYRKIKALTGYTATEFIRLTRLKMAVKLLETGKYNVSEIAYKVGFTSPSYFAKCFRDQYGKSPSEFIDKNRKS